MNPRRDPARTARWAIAVAVALGCIWIGLSALLVYPLPGGDARVFIPTAVRLAEGAGFDNPLLELAYRTDPRGEGRFCLYTPLFPWVLGNLLPVASARAAFGILALFRAAAVVWLAMLLFAVARPDGERSIDLTTTSLVCLMVAAYAGMFPPTYGRPEALASLFVLGGIAVERSLRGIPATLAHAALLGLLGATHPAGAVVAVILLAASRLARRSTPRPDLLHTGASAVAGVALCVALIAASPSGLADTIEGLRLHSAIQLDRSSSLARNVFYWVFWPNFFFFGPLFLWGLLLAFVTGWKRHGPSLTRTLFAVSTAVLLLSLWFFSWRAPPTAYNFALFQPVVYVVLVALVARAPEGALTARRPVRWATCVLVTCALAAPIRSTVLGAAMLRDGKTYHAARRQLAAFVDDDAFVFYTGSMWVLGSDYERMWEWGLEWRRPEPAPRAPRRLVQQETRLVGFRPPPSAPLVTDWRSGKTPRIFGMPLARTPAGYGFALWSLDEAMLARRGVPGDQR